MTFSSTDNYDWHVSQKQKDMLYDKIEVMSKKEAGLLIRLVQAILDDRPSNR